LRRNQITQIAKIRGIYLHEWRSYWRYKCWIRRSLRFQRGRLIRAYSVDSSQSHCPLLQSWLHDSLWSSYIY